MQGLRHPQAIRAIFFDVGYTLLAPHPSTTEIARAAVARRGHELDAECLRTHHAAAERQLRERAQALPWAWSDEAEINGMWTAYFTALLRPCLDVDAEELRASVAAVVAAFDEASSYALYPDVEPVLHALRERGLTLGVISDWGISLGLILRHHDLIQYFDFAVVSAQMRRAKPDPALFQTALERAEAIPDYAMHIGDSYVLDVLGARSVGITPVLLDRRRTYDPRQLDCLVAHTLYDALDLLGISRPDATQDAMR